MEKTVTLDFDFNMGELKDAGSGASVSATARVSLPEDAAQAQKALAGYAGEIATVSKLPQLVRLACLVAAAQLAEENSWDATSRTIAQSMVNLVAIAPGEQQITQFLAVAGAVSSGPVHDGASNGLFCLMESENPEDRIAILGRLLSDGPAGSDLGRRAAVAMADVLSGELPGMAADKIMGHAEAALLHLDPGKPEDRPTGQKIARIIHEANRDVAAAARVKVCDFLDPDSPEFKAELQAFVQEARGKKYDHFVGLCREILKSRPGVAGGDDSLKQALVELLLERASEPTAYALAAVYAADPQTVRQATDGFIKSARKIGPSRVYLTTNRWDERKWIYGHQALAMLPVLTEALALAREGGAGGSLFASAVIAEIARCAGMPGVTHGIEYHSHRSIAKNAFDCAGAIVSGHAVCGLGPKGMGILLDGFKTLAEDPENGPVGRRIGFLGRMLARPQRRDDAGAAKLSSPTLAA